MIKYTCGAGTPEEAETNCTYFIRGECTASFCEYRMKKQTRADKIRAMSDEELAKYLYQMQKNILRYVATVIGYSEEFDFADEAPDLLEWLQQPCEGGE